MRYLLTILCVLLLASKAALVTTAQAADQATQQAKPQPSAGPDSFQVLFSQWKATLNTLRKLREEYADAPAEKRKQLEALYQRQLVEAEALSPRVAAAAEKEYVRDPKNQDVASLLFAFMADQAEADNYEEAMRVTKLLIKNGFDHKGFPNFVGSTSFALSDFSTAHKYLTKAAETQAISGRSRESLTTIGSEKDAAKLDQMWKEEQTLRAKEAKADDLPRVEFNTTKGVIVLELFENEAPNTVANFISLVEKHYYDGLKFHRVIPGFMAQGGDPKGDGSGGPGYTIACECVKPEHRNHFRGSLSMAKTQRPDTGGSQFFLTFVPTPHLNGQHTVFGRVIEGMDVLSRLERTEPRARREPDEIISATVLRKRKHPYVPKTQAASGG